MSTDATKRPITHPVAKRFLVVFAAIVLIGLVTAPVFQRDFLFAILGIGIIGFIVSAFFAIERKPDQPYPPAAQNEANKLALAERHRLAERYQQTIEKYKNRMSLSGGYEVDNLVRDCITEIAQYEGRTEIAPQYEYLYRWRQRSDIPNEYRRLAEYLKTDFERRADKLRKQKEEQVALSAEETLSSNWDLVDKFLDITERKVSVVDDYGDERWDALPTEIVKCLRKINERDGLHVNWEEIKRPRGKNWETDISWHLPETYRWMIERLKQLFQEHHEKVKSKQIDEADLGNLTGVQFETHIARLLRSAGYDVTGTPTTGDQGADLIAKRDGRTVIVQAKRYQGAVGNKAVQEVVSAVSFYGGDEGWVVTNSTFTPSAVALAQKANVKLIDGTVLRNKAIF